MKDERRDALPYQSEPFDISGRRVPGHHSALNSSKLATKRKPSKYHTYGDEPRSGNLSWRLDPVESLSDWTLVVVSNENAGDETVPAETTIDGTSSVVSELSEKHDDHHKEQKAKVPTPAKRYFVHRAVLGVGPRKGDFFVDLFHKHRLALENQNDEKDDCNGDLEPITHIEVKPSAAAAFGAMLDFMYSPNDRPVKATTESAVALRHLSIALGIRELFNSVTPFIQKDLSAQTSPIYLFEAHRYYHIKLLNVAIKICASNFSEVKLSSLIILTPDLLERVLTSPHLKCASETLSSKVASYFRCRPNAINRENLLRFTPPDIMPIISSDEVIFFLHLMEETGLLNKRGKRNKNSRNNSLYERCIARSSEAVYKIMEKKLSLDTKSNIVRERQHRKNGETEFDYISFRVKAEILEKAFLESVSSKHISHTKVESRDSDASTKIKPLKSKNEKHKDTYTRIKDDYEERIASLERKLVEKEQTIERYSNELSKFARVPNQYRPPDLLSDHTYKREPIYDGYGESLYGYMPPTALPRYTVPDSEGWIFREERHDGRNSREMLWPMYYYKAN